MIFVIDARTFPLITACPYVCFLLVMLTLPRLEYSCLHCEDNN